MIVVFGSLIADLVFPVVALPRPGETVASPNVMVIPGGKGANQAVAAARSGAAVEMAGCVGGDAFGEMLVAGLTDGGVGTDRVARVASPTGCAAVCVDREGENQIAIAAGANPGNSRDPGWESRLDGGNDPGFANGGASRRELETDQARPGGRRAGAAQCRAGGGGAGEDPEVGGLFAG